MTPEELKAELIEHIKGKRHPHYKRTVELAEKYKQLITGECIEELMKQFVRREDDAMFKQRKEITQHITPAVSDSIMRSFQKVNRVKPVVKEIDFEGDDKSGEKKKNVDAALETFYGLHNFDYYMASRWDDLSFCDPNAFILVDIPPFDNNVEKAQPKPFEITSEMAAGYEYENRKLKYLVCMQGCKVKYDKTGQYQGRIEYEEKDGKRWTIWDEDEGIVAEEVDEKAPRVETSETTYYQEIDHKWYLVTTFEHKAGRVPAVIVGYVRDLVTDGETFVNPFHCAMPYFMKSIKTVSEFDLTMALHAYPQKLQYVEPCQIDMATQICPNSGYRISECTKCSKTGNNVATSAQEMVTFKLPRHQDEMIDLASLVKYIYPPIDLIKFQKEYIESLKHDVQKTVFNSEIFSKDEVAATATGKNIDLQNVYDTLYPYAQRKSEGYKYLVHVIATYRDVPDIIVRFQYPQDFKLKTVDELLAELQLATTSKAPSYIRQEIASDIARAMFLDKPNEFVKFEVKQQHFPFNGKTDTEIFYIISNENLCTEQTKVLWANFDSIFEQLQVETLLSADPVWFYDLTYDKRLELIDKKVAEIMKDITASAILAVPMGIK